MKVVDSVRSMLGVRRKRTLLRAGPKPRLGAKIVKGSVRMTVQAGLTDGAWRWLVAQGWREETYPNDRRAYRDVPPSCVARLFDAEDPVALGRLLEAAVAEAEVRPVVSLPPRR